MIHQIKALYKNGTGLSERKIAKELGISRHTVSKYLKMTEAEITKTKSETDRAKRLDDYRVYIIQLLQTYPGLSAVKIMRKLKAKVDDLIVSDRSVRRYIQALKQEISFKQPRYYEPVLDMIPGEQCQVDGGELRGVMIEGVETTVYIMVFVLSYSRLMHVSATTKAIDTKTLIHQHDLAFRYFGGMPKECVYDQTKLVVISEVFRELQLNQCFFQYATTAGFYIRVCEGYDPESKGKVEAGVKYVKHNGLYGETFANLQDLEKYLIEWLDNTANQRIHGTTKRQPREHYEHDERVKMLPYLTPAYTDNDPASMIIRKADKTGLISWQSNKYSVPMAYQCARVSVREQEGRLLISDLSNREILAEHVISLEKGQIIKNNHHYRDMSLHVQKLEDDLHQLLVNLPLTQSLCALLKATSPKIYKDQLYGAKQVLTQHIKANGVIPEVWLIKLIDLPRLTVTGLKERLEIYQQHPERLGDKEDSSHQSANSLPALACYGALNDRLNGQGANHVIH